MGPVAHHRPLFFIMTFEDLNTCAAHHAAQHLRRIVAGIVVCWSLDEVVIEAGDVEASVLHDIAAQYRVEIIDLRSEFMDHD